jgi:hypothetical protein
MDAQPALGRLFLVVGLALTGAGLLLLAGGRLPWLGRLPGDIRVERGGIALYVPLTTGLLLSGLLSLILCLAGRFLR